MKLVLRLFKKYFELPSLLSSRLNAFFFSFLRETLSTEDITAWRPSRTSWRSKQSGQIASRCYEGITKAGKSHKCTVFTVGQHDCGLDCVRGSRRFFSARVFFPFTPATLSARSALSQTSAKPSTATQTPGGIAPKCLTC